LIGKLKTVVIKYTFNGHQVLSKIVCQSRFIVKTKSSPSKHILQ